MENSVGSAIEKIKQQEQHTEAKLKAKREFEASKAATERSISEVISQVKKLRQEREDLLKKTDDLRSQLTIQRIRRDVLSIQLQSSYSELEDLKAKSVRNVSELHELRSEFCKAVQAVSDVCDVWALLIRPASTESLHRIVKPTENNEQEMMMLYDGKLKRALERREKAIVERDRLMAEPDTGEEFVRIKNALRYSLEMIANLRKLLTFPN